MEVDCIHTKKCVLYLLKCSNCKNNKNAKNPTDEIIFLEPTKKGDGKDAL